MQLSKKALLSVDGGLSILAANGKPNFNQRRSVDVAITSPSGEELYSAPGIWKDFKFAVSTSEIGTYKLWCAPSLISGTSSLRSTRALVVSCETGVFEGV